MEWNISRIWPLHMPNPHEYYSNVIWVQCLWRTRACGVLQHVPSSVCVWNPAEQNFNTRKTPVLRLSVFGRFWHTCWRMTHMQTHFKQQVPHQTRRFMGYPISAALDLQHSTHTHILYAIEIKALDKGVNVLLDGNYCLDRVGLLHPYSDGRVKSNMRLVSNVFPSVCLWWNACVC